MARKIVIWREEGPRPVLTEVLAEDEFQLQEIVKENPDLLPVDEFETTGPLMVVGRETTLPSGAPDLLCVAKSGELFIVEFKTGPQNSDFRRVLAQLLDYGSDLWQMSYEEFESTVVSRYFSSDHCRDDLLRGKDSLDRAVRAFWADLSEEEAALFRDNLSQRLSTGAFHYVVVAQRFMPSMEKTIEYLNAAMYEARFYAVELVRFATDGLSAFETRTLLKPEVRSSSLKREASKNEAQFLEQIEDDEYREVLQQLLEVCRGLGFRFSWGTAGTSIRLPVLNRSQPLSVAWLFPPGVSGWMGLSDLTLGYDSESYEETPPVALALENYVTEVAKLHDVETAKPEWLRGFHLDPEIIVRHRHQIADILARLVQRINEEV